MKPDEPCNDRSIPSASHNYFAALLSDADLVRQGAEAAARAKMFVRNTPLEHHYANLDSRLSALADRLER